MRYFFLLTSCLALCFAAQLLALRAVGGRTAKSESNFFSSIGRIQAGARGKPDVMFLGSSITGRLPDRAQGFSGTANMGCDGGSAVDALRAMDEEILPFSPQLIIEANTLQLALDGKTTEIARAMRGGWFKVGLHIPNLAAYARPAAFFYSKLLERRIGGFNPGGADEDLGVSSHPEIPASPASATLTKQQVELISEITTILERLRSNGSAAMIVWLPPTRSDQSPPPDWILELAHQTKIPFWDLGADAASGRVNLTDGVHMDAASASRTMVTLTRQLNPNP